MPDLLDAHQPKVLTDAGHELCWDCLLCRWCSLSTTLAMDLHAAGLRQPACIDRTNVAHFCPTRRFFFKTGIGDIFAS